jgi:hypothetical protein
MVTTGSQSLTDLSKKRARILLEDSRSHPKDGPPCRHQRVLSHPILVKDGTDHVWKEPIEFQVDERLGPGNVQVSLLPVDDNRVVELWLRESKLVHASHDECFPLVPRLFETRMLLGEREQYLATARTL